MVGNPEKCEHYASFTQQLTRVHFDAIYWSLFFVVIGLLFVASWIYQSVMKFGERPDIDRPEYDHKLKIGLAYTSGLFLLAAVAVVMEVFCLLALQFCDGEDLMSLYWSTWTMLQLGAEIAILGVVLALYHALFDIKHPRWALALGTPVLVVAGFGHVIPILFRMGCRKLKLRHEEKKMRSRNNSQAGLSMEKTNISAATSIRQVEQPSRANSVIRPLPPLLQQQQDQSPTAGRPSGIVLLEINTGGRDEDIRQWPSCVRVGDGKALIQATIRYDDGVGDFDLEAQRPTGSTSA